MGLYSLDKRALKNRINIPKLSEIKVPFLPEKKKGDSEYTLVLDMDETLIHTQFNKNGEISFATRPYLNRFLTELAKDFEINVFTAGTQDYADSILNDIDKEGLIKHRLYRQHCQTNNPFLFQKDLRKIGRDLHKSIIIDDRKDNYDKTTPDNGINIKAWISDKNDLELKKLIPFLHQIVKNKEQDVRPILHKFRDHPEEYTKEHKHHQHHK